jgi:hypothetical protein
MQWQERLHDKAKYGLYWVRFYSWAGAYRTCGQYVPLIATPSWPNGGQITVVAKSRWWPISVATTGPYSGQRSFQLANACDALFFTSHMDEQLDALRCMCGRTFTQEYALSNHQRHCKKTKKRLAGTLEKAKELWIMRKRPRLHAPSCPDDRGEKTTGNPATSSSPLSLSLNSEASKYVG